MDLGPLSLHLRSRSASETKVAQASANPQPAGSSDATQHVVPHGAEDVAAEAALFALVEDVAVHPDAQGRGVGRALMDEAMRIARDAGCYKLALSSNSKRSKAHAFYESLGYERHGVSFVAVPEEVAT